MTNGHPDFEGLSAHLDGEAPEWDAHVAGCAACQATLDRLRTVSALISAPLADPPVDVGSWRLPERWMRVGKRIRKARWRRPARPPTRAPAIGLRSGTDDRDVGAPVVRAAGAFHRA